MRTPNRMSSENLAIFNKASQDAMKIIFLLNGGASIAFLTLVGTVAISADSTIKIGELASALLYFTFGAGLVAAAHGLDYVCLLLFNLEHSRAANFTFWLTFIAGLVALILYFVGVVSAYKTFSGKYPMQSLIEYLPSLC